MQRDLTWGIQHSAAEGLGIEEGGLALYSFAFNTKDVLGKYGGFLFPYHPVAWSFNISY